MWKDDDKAPVWEFIGWVFAISAVCKIAVYFLEPYSILFSENGILTAGYALYAFIGIFFSTPAPMIAAIIVLARHKKIRSAKEFLGLVFRTPKPLKTVLITCGFCAAALVAALVYGTPNGSPWYLMLLALPVLIIGGGVEEIGWRGFLQPALEQRLPFPAATILTGAIWYVWHLPLWLIPTSNHYEDSLIGFAINIFVWAFVSAAIYKATQSVFACVMHHAFINSIGAIYDWNALFDAFPNAAGMYVYFAASLAAAVILWLAAEKKPKSIM